MPAIIINFEQLRLSALAAVTDYQQGATLLTYARDGYYHGSTGQLRASRLSEYLNRCHNSEEKTLATLIALFGEMHPGFFASIGKSSRLASLVSNRVITGNAMRGSVNLNTLQTTVFSREALDASIQEDANYQMQAAGTGAHQYFDSTLAVRKLLHQHLNEHVTEERRLAILASALRIKIRLEQEEKTINYYADFPTPLNQKPMNQIQMHTAPAKLEDTVKHYKKLQMKF